jgi:peptide/nickel transport system substrate-binding protein
MEDPRLSGSVATQARPPLARQLAHIVPDNYIVNQAFEPSMMLGAVTSNPFKHDPDKAKELLAQAGYAQGFTATLDHPANPPFGDIATAIQADLAAVGIRVSLLSATGKQLVTKMRDRQHQMILNLWFPDYFDPNSNAQAFNSDPDDSDNSPLKIIAWRCHFHDEELIEEVAQAAEERDTQKRAALYRKMQQQAWDRSPFAFMLQQTDVAVARRNVAGFPPWSAVRLHPLRQDAEDVIRRSCAVT